MKQIPLRNVLVDIGGVLVGSLGSLSNQGVRHNQ